MNAYPYASNYQKPVTTLLYHTYSPLFQDIDAGSDILLYCSFPSCQFMIVYEGLVLPRNGFPSALIPNIMNNFIASLYDKLILTDSGLL